MKYDFDKIILTINNENNQFIHISAIQKMIQNFELKWSKEDSSLFEDFMHRLNVSLNDLRIKFDN